ncbi:MULTISPECIES: hypothetical protein [unclassified Nodularia (in: cyanobacteria)]|uniref:hypothetical protein n=1 Tax=unclassified Nodularia (in: cyanobacteria) TaxID=2656917 RepID=UPI001D114600|nr:hypothetical protein [Nodularia sp. LEGE 04288]MCC2692124.1 hypothetical protein [Nodularia sp. LEGE 04288]
MVHPWVYLTKSQNSNNAKLGQTILDFGFWILDFGFWIDPTDKASSVVFSINSTETSGGLYH